MFSFPYIIAGLVSVIASVFLFHALINSIIGEAVGLQRLKRFFQEKGWKRRIDIAAWIIIFVVVNFAVDRRTITGAILAGVLVGLVVGFGSVVKPDSSEK